MANKTATSTLNNSATQKNQNSSHCTNHNNKERPGGRNATYAWSLEFRGPGLDLRELRSFAEGVLMCHCNTGDFEAKSLNQPTRGAHQSLVSYKIGHHYGKSIRGRGTKVKELLMK